MSLTGEIEILLRRLDAKVDAVDLKIDALEVARAKLVGLRKDLLRLVPKGE